MKNFATVIKTLFVTALLAIASVVGFAWSGLYPVAAGSGHTAPVSWLLETVRQRSVAVRAADLMVPDDLDSSERIAAGAGHYKNMCVDCHGRPGREPAAAFEPTPPALYRYRVDAAEAFWTIKHGLKMTAMPSHLDHSDRENWDTVAFVRALPDMDAAEYESVTAEATHDHGDGGGHDHGDGTDDHQADADPESQSGQSGSSADTHDHGMTADSPEAAVDGFRHALAEGRGEDALAYLHPGATIVEGGHVQAVNDYRGGHLGSDMAFLGKIDIELLSRTTQSTGGQATVETRSRFVGEVDGQALDLESTEFATLVETDEGWRISQVAWSARPYGGDDESPDPAQDEDTTHEHASGDDDHDH